MLHATWVHLHDEIVDHGRLQLQTLAITYTVFGITATVSVGIGSTGTLMLCFIPLVSMGASWLWWDREYSIRQIASYLSVVVEPELPEACRWESNLRSKAEVARDPFYRRYGGALLFSLLNIGAVALVVVMNIDETLTSGIVASSLVVALLSVIGVVQTVILTTWVKPRLANLADVWVEIVDSTPN